jgi:hypothetical protein
MHHHYRYGMLEGVSSRMFTPRAEGPFPPVAALCFALDGHWSIETKGKPMGLWSWFACRRKPATAAGRPAFAASIKQKEQEPSTPEQKADLKAAWDELAEAAKESAATSFHACSRGGKPWQEDPAAVRNMAALLRRIDAEDAATEGPTAK